MTVIAEPVETDTGAAEDQAPDGIIGESMEFVDGSAIDGIVEVESLREENAKHFKLTDGTYEMVVYGDAVHRKDADGNWQDIDNNLALQTVSGNQLYSTGDLRTSFAKAFVPNTTLFTLNENGYSISMALVSDTLSLETGNLTMDATDEAVLNAVAAEATVANAPERSESKTYSSVQEAAEINNRSSISYSNVRANTDIEYVLTGNDIKENIIVKQQGGNYDYEFKITLVGLSAVLNDDNTVTFIDKTDAQEKYMIPLPYMYDANGEVSYDVQYGLESLGNDTYILSVSADEGWINAAERAFPVVIDPTIKKTMFYDTYIHSGYPTTNYSSEDKLWVSNVRTSFMSGFLPALPEGATFNEAYLCASYYYYDSVTTGYVTVGAYQVLEYWIDTGLTWNIANENDNLGISTTCLDSQILSATVGATADDPQWMTFDITDAVAAWYNGSENCGIALKYEGGTNESVIFNSYEAGEAYRPYYNVRYTYYLPDGVYALKNVGNSGLWMDTQYDSYNTGMHIQQYAYTTSPTETFSKGGLFKISRVSGTERYIIRLMTNNNLTFGISGTEVLTKEIPSADEDVSIYDTFYIGYETNGFTLNPYGTSYWIGANVTSASGSSGAPASYLKPETKDETASLWATWELVQYTGAHRQGSILFIPSSWNSEGIVVNNTYTVTSVVYSTYANVNIPYIELDSDDDDLATAVWDATEQKLTLTAQLAGGITLNSQVMNSDESTVLDAGDFTFSIVPEEGIYYIRNMGTKRYIDIEGPSKASGAIVQQWDFHTGDYERWIVEHVEDSGGYIRLKSVYSGLYIGVDSSDTSVIRQYSTKNDYTLWKIGRTWYGDVTFTCKATESSGVVLSVPETTNLNGTNLTQVAYTRNSIWCDEWDMHKIEYTSVVNNYYDKGYFIRNGYTEAEAQALIEEYSLVVAEVYLKAFGLALSVNDAQYFKSALDECKGTVTVDNVTQECDHEEDSHSTREAVKDSFIQAHQGDAMITNVLWTCHKITSLTPNEKGVDENRSCAYPTLGIVLLLYVNETASATARKSKSQTVLMHELNHQYGVPDHYHEEDTDGSCRGGEFCAICGDNPRPSSCIMNDTSGSNLSVSGFLCDGCQTDLYAHLNSHHAVE